MVKGSIEWECTPDKGLTLHINPASGALAGAEVFQHTLAAQKEMLLALRSLIDVAVKHMDTREGSSGQPATKIKID